MTSHRERIKAQTTKGVTLPKDFQKYSGQTRSNIRSEGRGSKRRSDYSYTDGNSPISPVSDEKVYANDPSNDKIPRSHNYQLAHSKRSIDKSRNTGMTYSKGYMSVKGDTHQEMIYKSQSLHALKASEPTKVLAKSTIQQEYHDQMVRHYLRGLSYGRARKPCRIAAVMFVLFALMLIAGLTVICLTYIYWNIMLSLDKGEAIGPALCAFSFVFMGLGIKFLYDAHKISQFEKNAIRYEGYDHRYIGLKSSVKMPTPKVEKLASGHTTANGLSRKPREIHNPGNLEGAYSTLKGPGNSTYRHNRDKASSGAYNINDRDRQLADSELPPVPSLSPPAPPSTDRDPLEIQNNQPEFDEEFFDEQPKKKSKKKHRKQKQQQQIVENYDEDYLEPVVDDTEI